MSHYSGSRAVAGAHRGLNDAQLFVQSRTLRVKQLHLIGVVSMTDIGRNMAEPSDVESSRRSGFYRDIAVDLTLEDLGQRYLEERAFTVRDVMTPVIHQVPVTASGAEAARLMIDRHIHRLVVTQGKQPVGIITSLDLLKMLAEQHPLHRLVGVISL